MTAKRSAMKYRVARAVVNYPKWTWATLASVATVLAALGGGVVYVVNYFVAKSDFVNHIEREQRQSAWHDVGHINMRVERLGDEVDRLSTRKLVQGNKLSPTDEAEARVWQRKLETAAGQLVEAQRAAKEASKEKH